MELDGLGEALESAHGDLIWIVWELEFVRGGGYICTHSSTTNTNPAILTPW